jgi:hypothetical protein
MHLVMLWALLAYTSIVYFILYLIFALTIYALWLVLAFRGRPSGSWLVKLLHKREDKSSQVTSETATAHSRPSMKRQASEEEEGFVRRMEAEMAGRDVMVLTIPKRKLTVVNV